MYCIYLSISFLKRTLESRNLSNGHEINYKMKTLIVAFMILFKKATSGTLFSELMKCTSYISLSGG